MHRVFDDRCCGGGGDIKQKGKMCGGGEDVSLYSFLVILFIYFCFYILKVFWGGQSR